MYLSGSLCICTLVTCLSVGQGSETNRLGLAALCLQCPGKLQGQLWLNRSAPFARCNKGQSNSRSSAGTCTLDPAKQQRTHCFWRWKSWPGRRPPGQSSSSPRLLWDTPLQTSPPRRVHPRPRLRPGRHRGRDLPHRLRGSRESRQLLEQRSCRRFPSSLEGPTLHTSTLHKPRADAQTAQVLLARLRADPFARPFDPAPTTSVATQDESRMPRRGWRRPGKPYSAADTTKHSSRLVRTLPILCRGRGRPWCFDILQPSCRVWGQA